MASPVEILSEMALGDGGKHGHHGGVKPIPTIIREFCPSFPSHLYILHSLYQRTPLTLACPPSNP